MIVTYMLFIQLKEGNNTAFQITHTGYAIDMHNIVCLHVSAQVKIASY